MKIKICPNCKSINITGLGGQSWQQASGIFNEKCLDCGYEGFMPLVEESELKKLKKKI
jgi:RNase P subunit RPR2